MAFDSFKKQSEAYLNKIQANIDEEMNGLLLMNLQSLSAGRVGPSQHQFAQHLQNLRYTNDQTQIQNMVMAPAPQNWGAVNLNNLNQLYLV